jgi:hypothetical protein
VQLASALEVPLGGTPEAADLVPRGWGVRRGGRLELLTDVLEVGPQLLDRRVQIPQLFLDLSGQRGDPDRSPLHVRRKVGCFVRQVDCRQRSLLPLVDGGPGLAVPRLCDSESLVQGLSRPGIAHRFAGRRSGADRVPRAGQALEGLVRQALGPLGAALDVRNVGFEGGEPGVESFGLLEPRAEVAGLKLLRRAEPLSFLPPDQELLPPIPVLVLIPARSFAGSCR